MFENQSDAEVVGSLRSVGIIRSELTNRRAAPKQGNEGAPDVWLEIHHWAKAGLSDSEPHPPHSHYHPRLPGPGHCAVV